MTVYLVWLYWQHDDTSELAEIFTNLEAANEYVADRAEKYEFDYTIKEFITKDSYDN